jgi:heavy metal sensor kinase
MMNLVPPLQPTAKTPHLNPSMRLLRRLSENPFLSKLEWLTGSLRWRITLEVAALFVVGLGSVGLWSGWKMQQILIASHIQNVKYIAERFPRDVEVYSDMLPPPKGLQRTIDSTTRPGLVIWVKNQQGQLLAQSANLNQEPTTSDILMRIAQMPLEPTVYPVGQRYFILSSARLKIGATPMGMVYLAQDVTTEQLELQTALRSLALVTLLATGMVILALTTRIRQALQPLVQLSQLATGLEPDRLSQTQLPVTRAPREVTALAEALNMMLDRLSEAWQRQRQFVSDVSHELRTPLTIMLGYVQMVLRRGQNLNEGQRESLEIAVAEANRTVLLLQELLDLARADDRHLRLNLEPLVLNELIEEVVKSMADLNHRPILVMAPELVSALADRARLRQVLINLLENAIRYSEPEQPVQVSLSQSNPRVLIQVQDQGIGISPDNQQRIFERFYRADEARSRSTGGTGLGLAIVKTFVEAMGGSISVQSQLGQGSTFTIALMPIPH